MEFNFVTLIIVWCVFLWGAVGWWKYWRADANGADLAGMASRYHRLSTNRSYAARRVAAYCRELRKQIRTARVYGMPSYDE